MRHLIDGPVGAGQENKPENVRRARAALRAAADHNPDLDDLSAYTDTEFDERLRNFQDDNGLLPDGYMEPGGETERNLVARLTGEGLDEAGPDDARLSGPVGAGGDNDTRDVQTVKRVLGTLGHLKYDRTRQPFPYIDSQTVEAVEVFQRENGLFDDGRIDPNGETIQKIREALKKGPVRPNLPNIAPWQKQELFLPASDSLRPASTNDPAGLPAGTTSFTPIKGQARKGSILFGERDLERDRQDLSRVAKEVEQDAVEKLAQRSAETMARREDQFRSMGFEQAADNAERFRNKRGDLKMSRDEARRFEPVRDMEEENRRKFEETTLVGESAHSAIGNAEKLRSLKDGESVEITDDNNANFANTSLDAEGALANLPSEIAEGVKDPGFYLAFGRSTMNSKLNLVARREGDTIYIEGTVTHNWDDRYNFADGQPGATDAKNLSRAGKAEEFRFGAGWTQKVSGTVQIENGELTNPQITWTD